MHHLQTLYRQDLLNPYLWNCDVLICPFFQFGKAHKRTYHKGVIVKNIIKKPGYIIHMDQEVSSKPGRLLTVSGKPPNKECTIISLFIGSISEKIFVEFQEGASAKETIISKVRVKADANTCDFKIK